MHEITPEETKRARHYIATPLPRFLAERLALLAILQDRAVAYGDPALPAAYGLAIASMARAKISADRDRGSGIIDLPQFIEVFEGKTREDFRREHVEHTRAVLEGTHATPGEVS